MKKPSESDLVRQCLQWLWLRGVLSWRNNAGTIPLPGGKFRRFVGMRGAGDIFAVLPPGGLFCSVECKTPGGRLSREQKAFAAAVAASGGLALVVRSLDDLISGLKEYLP